MNDDTEHDSPSDMPECPRTRLAQGALAAVDLCRCGMIQLHIGAITLRLDERALGELAETLERAVATHARKLAPANLAGDALGLRPQKRGQA